MTPTREEVLANGRICCVLHLACCPGGGANIEAQVKARAEIIYAFSGLPQVEELPEWALTCAREERKHFDLTPAGCGPMMVAMAEAYRPVLEKAERRKKEK